MNTTDTLFIFTTSPAGLGHIRVMDAIKDGKPSGIKATDVGITNIKANRIHDLGSRVKFFVKFTEFYQTNHIAESFMTFWYRIYLHRHTKDIIDEFTKIANANPAYKKWVIISTHFALAHSISSAKNYLEKKLNIKIYLCVVVTDDSPQKIWAVHGSDLTFVPSAETKINLQKFFNKERADSIKVISYPIAPRLTQSISTADFQFIINQLDTKTGMSSSSSGVTQIEIPISGAAVQLNYFEKFIEKLCRLDYVFTVIGQESMLSQKFFEDIRKLPRVQVSIGRNPWEAVNFYESLFYQPNRPSIEITKPSEQAFKALLNPRQRGGVILLLTAPIGRQEYDNINFLTRNGLMPTEIENKQLFVEEDLKKWIEKAKAWRAIKLPKDPIKAADFVRRLKQSGIFYAMLFAIIPNKPELKDYGVRTIWEEIGKIV
ncbi:MAG TPA: hypothetical protein VG895_00980 [Patescibacteria group bacterium]|nr:hypothetical protein [Patescibacteria group bacterium]